MKQSMLLTMCAVLAFAMTGCRYDKSNAGADAAADNAAMNAGGDTENLDANANDPNVESGSLSDISASDREAKSWADLGYKVCTDVNFEPVYFGFDATIIQNSELYKIDAVTSHLKDKTDRVVQIEGNCDERGSNEYNVGLGENRAIMLRNYLIENGIDVARIKTVSNGEENPAVQGNDESAWSKNRRGEFFIYSK